MKTFYLSLVTPERKLFDEMVSSVTLPIRDGEVTILPDHVPYIGDVHHGEAVVRRLDGSTETLALLGGFVELHGNTLTILADAAERADEIDIARAEAAAERAREIREHTLDASLEEQERAVAALERAWARLRVAWKHRGHRGDIPETGE